MELRNLKKEIPYRWKVQTVSKFKPQASCVAYIDARDCMDLLDDVCGAENWQDSYTEIAGKLFCSVGIHISSRWVHKTDVGTESSYEKDKGLVSDAFKRACVKWGVGRFLYDLDIRFVATDVKKDGNNHPVPVDDNGKRIWDLTAHFKKGSPKKKEPEKKEEPQMDADDFKLIKGVAAIMCPDMEEDEVRSVVVHYNPTYLKSKGDELKDGDVFSSARLAYEKENKNG